MIQQDCGVVGGKERETKRRTIVPNFQMTCARNFPARFRVLLMEIRRERARRTRRDDRIVIE